MSKERLEDIKHEHDFLGVIHRSEHIEWLIEQAERVEELEDENRILRTVAESNKYIGEQYLEQNKRYREAMQNARSELAFITLLRPDMDTEEKINTAKRIINFALEGD